MKKSDLKNGMIVEVREGDRYMILRDSFQRGHDIAVSIRGGYGYWMLDTIGDDLTDTGGDKTFDIMKVYCTEDFDFGQLKSESLKLLWERPTEKKKYTYTQLKELLGEEFEIVRE